MASGAFLHAGCHGPINKRLRLMGNPLNYQNQYGTQSFPFHHSKKRKKKWREKRERESEREKVKERERETWQHWEWIISPLGVIFEQKRKDKMPLDWNCGSNRLQQPEMIETLKHSVCGWRRGCRNWICIAEQGCTTTYDQLLKEKSV